MRYLPLLILLGACTPPLEVGFESALTRQGACGDLLVFAASEDDTTMIELRSTDPFGDLAADDARTVTLGLGAQASLVATLGTNVADLTCDSDQTDGGPDLQIQYVATEGSAEVTATSVAGVVTVDVTVTDAVLREASVGYYEVALDAWTLTAVEIGGDFDDDDDGDVHETYAE